MAGRYTPVPMPKRIEEFDVLLNMSDDQMLTHQLIYDGLITVFGYENGLKRFEVKSFFLVWDHLRFAPDINKTSLLRVFRVMCDYGKHDIRKEVMQHFELTANKRFVLSVTGVSLRSQWFTSLRRVLQDKKEFYRLVYLQFDSSEIAKRRSHKKFYKLPEDEQIRIIRDFHAIPFNTPEQKKIRTKAAKAIYMKYDIGQYDIMSFIKKHGRVITSVRDHPDIAPLFNPIS